MKIFPFTAVMVTEGKGVGKMTVAVGATVGGGRGVAVKGMDVFSETTSACEVEVGSIISLTEGLFLPVKIHPCVKTISSRAINTFLKVDMITRSEALPQVPNSQRGWLGRCQRTTR